MNELLTKDNTTYLKGVSMIMIITHQSLRNYKSVRV